VSGRLPRWLLWPALGAVLVAALAVGARGDGGPRTDADRVTDLTSSFQCPTCRGQSVRDSNAPVASAIRSDVARRVEEGESDDEIRDAIVQRYGDEVLLNPPSSGVAGLVWVLPVAVLVASLAGLALAFRRWQVAWP
jgi:cytochrome c-type biogenesis protein CcmH/NrfF